MGNDKSSRDFFASMKHSWIRLGTGAKVTVIVCALSLVAVITAVIITLAGSDSDGPSGGVLPPSGEVDKSVSVIKVLASDAVVDPDKNIDLGIAGATSLVLVYNKAPAGAYLKVTENLTDEDVVANDRVIKGSMGGFSTKYGGYLVIYTINFGYSATAARSFTAHPYYTDSKGNTAIVGEEMTFTQPRTFLGIGTGGKISEFPTVIVESGEETECMIFTGGHCKDLVITLSTKRTGVATEKIVPTSNEYNSELGCYVVTFTVPALVYDDSDGAVNRYTVTAAPSSSSTSTESYRIQIRDPDSNIDPDGWRPIN